MICYRRRTNNKISKKKNRACGEKPRENQVQNPESPLPVELYRTCLIAPTKICDNVCEILSSGGVHKRLGAQGFYCGFIPPAQYISKFQTPRRKLGV